MGRLRCWVFGHEWGPWWWMWRDGEGAKIRSCESCGLIDAVSTAGTMQRADGTIVPYRKGLL